MRLERLTAPDPGGIPEGITQSYDYDSLNRLSTASETSAGTAWSQTYAYDRYSNRAVTVGAGHGQMPSLTSTALAAFSASNNRILSSGFDNAGNMTQDMVGRIFSYDGKNRQKTFDGGLGNTVQYPYDGDGKRIKKIQGGTTTLYVYNAFGNLIAEYSDHTSTSEDGGKST